MKLEEVIVYSLATSGGGLTPLFDADGKPIITK